MTLRIITPRLSVEYDGVTAVTLPGSEGSFTVLHNHAPIIAMLDKGIVRWNDGSCSIKGGFVQVRNNLIKVVAETE